MNQGHQIPILCFHQVGTESKEGRKLNIDPKNLENLVRFFSRQGFEFLSGKTLNFSRKGVWFGFDDAFAGAVELAVPIFKRFEGTATFYAVTGLVGESSAWDPGDEKILASWDALKEAKAEGFEIGNHTVLHPNLGITPARASEVLIAKTELAVRLGESVHSFCYPYGGWSPEALEAVQKAGYQYGVGLGRRAASIKDNPLLLPRIVIGFSDRVPQLLYKWKIRCRLPLGKKRQFYVP